MSRFPGAAWGADPDAREPGHRLCVSASRHTSPGAIEESRRVDLWQVDLDGFDEWWCMRSLLVDEELDRLDRFHFEDDARRFVVSRVAQRDLLSRYLETHFDRVEVLLGRWGKPYLRPGSGRRLRFNLSHSGEKALIAVSWDQEIGIDVERHKELAEFEDLVARYFSAQESATIIELEPAVRQVAFFDCWTRKEALVKAIGGGLSLPLDLFSVPLFDDGPICFTEGWPGTQGWQSLGVAIGNNYSAAFAARHSASVHRFHWNSNYFEMCDGTRARHSQAHL